MNLINLDERDLDRRIYRIVPVSRLVGMFRSGMTSLSSTQKWDDPFENKFFESLFQKESAITTNVVLRQTLFGQCWSFTGESDAMWRIYAPSKNGARITSTPRRLLETIDVADRENLYLAKVHYFDRRKAKQLLRQSVAGSSTLRDVVAGAAVKRIEFQHENEVRLLYSKKSGDTFGGVPIGIRPYKFCLELLFDPRMSEDEYYVYERFFRRRSFSGKLGKSQLYEL